MASEQEKRSGVYVFLCLDTRRVKIGLSTDVDTRKKAIQATCPTELTEELFVPVEDPKGLEKFLHKEFKEYRIHNEWFDAGIHKSGTYRLLIQLYESGLLVGEPPNEEE